MSIANTVASPEVRLKLNTLTKDFDGAIAALRALGIPGAVTEEFIKTHLVPEYNTRHSAIQSTAFDPNAKIEAVVKKTRAKRSPAVSADPGDTGVQAEVKKAPAKAGKPGKDADMM